MYVTPEVMSVITAFLGAVATLFGGMYLLLQRFESRIDRKFEQAEAREDERFNRVNERFDKVDDRFDRSDDRFDKIDDRFDKIDGRFDKIDGRFDRSEVSTNERFDRLEAKFDGKFDLIRAEIQVMGADIVDLKVAVARLEGPQPTLIRAR